MRISMSEDLSGIGPSALLQPVKSKPSAGFAYELHADVFAICVATLFFGLLLLTCADSRQGRHVCWPYRLRGRFPCCAAAVLTPGNFARTLCLIIATAVLLTAASLMAACCMSIPLCQAAAGAMTAEQGSGL